MKDFQPTHFIEIYSGQDGFSSYTFTPLPIEYLDHQLHTTKSCPSLKTVAVFKIQEKKVSDACFENPLQDAISALNKAVL